MSAKRSILDESYHGASAWLFDFDGTLTDYDTADRAAVQLLRRKWFGDIPDDLFHVESVTARTSFYRTWAAGETRLGLDQSRIAALCDRFGRPEIAHDAVATYRAALLAGTRPAPGALELLAHLAGMCSVGIVTNAYDAEAQRARITATGLDRWVDVVIVAVEVGYFKPDPRIMTAAAEALGVAPAECIYVGDSHEFDVAAAAAAGMHPIYLGNQARPVQVPSFATLQDLRDDLVH